MIWTRLTQSLQRLGFGKAKGQASMEIATTRPVVYPVLFISYGEVTVCKNFHALVADCEPNYSTDANSDLFDSLYRELTIDRERLRQLTNWHTPEAESVLRVFDDSLAANRKLRILLIESVFNRKSKYSEDEANLDLLFSKSIPQLLDEYHDNV